MKPEGYESGISSIGLFDYWRGIWKRKWLVLIVAGAVFGATIWNTSRSVPVYEAAASIRLLGSSSYVVLDRPQSGGVLIPTPIGLASGIEIIKSRMIAARTAIRLQKHYTMMPLPPGTFFEISDVLITETARPGEYTLNFTDDVGNYVVLDPNGRQIGAGRPGQAFSAAEISFTISNVSSKAGMAAQIVFHSLPALADHLRNALTLSADPETNLIRLRVRANDPQEAARIANAFGEIYGEFTREEKILHLQNMRRFLKEHIEGMRQELLKAGEVVAESGIQKREAESIAGLLAGDQAISPGASSKNIATTLLSLEVQRATLFYRYAANHPLIDQIDREIANLRNRLGKHLRVGQQDIKLRDLIRDAQSKAALYAGMVQREWEASIAEASETGSARIIDRAIPSSTPIAPNVQRNLTFGGMLALSLGLGLALLLNFLDTSVKDVKDIEEGVRLPTFGVIPQITNGSRSYLANLRGRKGRGDDLTGFLVGIDGKTNWAAEAYRSLRTNLQFALPEAPVCVFLFTSPGPSEGKSLTVANLAITLGHLDKRVLIVDADFRRSTQGKLFQIPMGSGLSEVLSQNHSWRDVIQSTLNKRMDIMPCGRTPPNPADLLAGSALSAFLDEAKQHYDIILIDSPPVLLYTDACVIGPLVNGVFLVVRADVTARETIVRAQSLLGAVNARVIGAILNGVTRADQLRYYAYYHDHEDDPSDSETAGKKIHWMRLKDNVRRFLSRISRI